MDASTTGMSPGVQIANLVVNALLLLLMPIAVAVAKRIFNNAAEKVIEKVEEQAESAKAERLDVKVALEKSRQTVAEHAEEVKEALVASTNLVAENVAEVKNVLAESTSQQVAATKELKEGVGNLAIVTKASHTFLNSGHGAVLREKASDKRKIAEVTGLQSDWDIVAEADKNYVDHISAQSAVDGQFGTDAQKKGNP